MLPSGGVAYLDTETTGLHPERHEVYEVGLIIDDTEHHWWLPVEHLDRADPIALSIGRFHERHLQGNAVTWAEPESHRPDLTGCSDFAQVFAKLTHGRHLVGAVVSFDEQRLAGLLRRYNVSPSWHYHTICVEALAAGFLAGSRRAMTQAFTGDVLWAGTDTLRAAEGPDHNPPWDSNALSLAVGVDPGDFDRHTALGDCRWARAIYEAVMG